MKDTKAEGESPRFVPTVSRFWWLPLVGEIVGDVLRDEADGVLQHLAGSEMVAREHGEDDRPAGCFEHADVVADIGKEVAGLVRDGVPRDVTRNTRPIELTAHDAQHQ